MNIILILTTIFASVAYSTPVELDNDSIMEVFKHAIDKTYFETDLSTTVPGLLQSSRHLNSVVTEIYEKKIEGLLGNGVFTTRSLARRISYERQILPLEWRILIANTNDGEECGQMCMVASSIGMYEAFKYAVDNCKPSTKAIKYAPLASFASFSSLTPTKLVFIKKWLAEYNPDIDSFDKYGLLTVEEIVGENIGYFAEDILGDLKSSMTFMLDAEKHFEITGTYQLYLENDLIDPNDFTEELLNVESFMSRDNYLNVAIARGRIDFVQQLIDAGATVVYYVTVDGEKKWTSRDITLNLNEAFDHSSSEIFEDKYIPIIKLLKKHGFTIERSE